MFSSFWKDEQNKERTVEQPGEAAPDKTAPSSPEEASDASAPSPQPNTSAESDATPTDHVVHGAISPPVYPVSEEREVGEGGRQDGEELPAAQGSDDHAPADEQSADLDDVEPATNPKRKALLHGRRRGRRLAKPEEATKIVVDPEQRLLLLDTWRRSGLSAADFAAMVGVSKHTLYKWRQRFTEMGPEGLLDQPRCRKGSKLPDLTKRAIMMMKETNPDWGCQRIRDMLARGPALPASASAVAKVLKEAGYQTVEQPTRNHPQRVRRFERAKPNQLWQTDLFTFMLKRQNRRLYLVAFMDDHSRFIVSFGITASATTAQVIEVLEAGIASHGAPAEVLTDNGPQYVTWRGKSRFSKHLEKRGIRQIIARPKRPQTLGKIERFWGTLWREFLETAIFTDLEDARRRIAFFIDDYNFSRVHRGIDGLVPADRFFEAAPEVLRMMKQRVAINALELARHGAPKKPFYVTGQVDGQSFSVHNEGERLILRREGEEREEVELTAPAPESQETSAPLCADGSLASPPGEPADQQPPLPGESVIPLEQDARSTQDIPASDSEKGGDA